QRSSLGSRSGSGGTIAAATATVRKLLVQRLCVVSLPMLLLLVACTHERSAARPSAPQAATAPAPASTPAPSPDAPPAAPAAAPPANAPASSPAPDAAAAPAPSKAGSAPAARSSRPT